jgi:hypothetical protein
MYPAHSFPSPSATERQTASNLDRRFCAPVCRAICPRVFTPVRIRERLKRYIGRYPGCPDPGLTRGRKRVAGVPARTARSSISPLDLALPHDSRHQRELARSPALGLRKPDVGKTCSTRFPFARRFQVVCLAAGAHRPRLPFVTSTAPPFVTTAPRPPHSVTPHPHHHRQPPASRRCSPGHRSGTACPTSPGPVPTASPLDLERRL